MVPWLVLGVLGLVVAPGCSDAFGVTDVLGIWNTQSIGSYPVPGSVVYQGTTFDTQYARWAFYDGGRCTLTQQVDGTLGTFDDCTFTVNMEQKTIAMVFQARVWDGTVAGDRMTLTDPQDVVWELRAQ
jgi:hypothetical protein